MIAKSATPPRPRGRPDEGRTETIRKRRVDVYLPTLEAKARWNATAEDRNQTLSEMVFQLVETALAPPEAGSVDPAALVRHIEALQAELGHARERIAELEIIKDRLERDLEEYRAAQATGETLPKMDARLLGIFREAKEKTGAPRSLEAAELRQALRIQPKDTERLKALQLALEALETHGLIRKNRKGWAWNG